MKSLSLICLFSFLISASIKAQHYEPLFSKTERKFVEKKNGKPIPIDPKVLFDRLYHKKTGEKISQKEFATLIKDKKYRSLDYHYDKYGELDRYVYDPSAYRERSRRSIATNKKLIPGKMFPESILIDIDKDTISLHESKDKLVILHFVTIKDGEIVNKSILKNLEHQISTSPYREHVEALLFPTSYNEEIDIDFLRNTSLRETSFRIIHKNAMSFMRKWHVKRVPSTLVIKKGEFEGTYKSHEFDLGSCFR